MWASVGGPASPPGLDASATSGRPVTAGMGLEVERPELIHADDHVGVAGRDVVGAIHEPVQVQNAVLLGFEVGVGGLLPGLQALKGHALLAEQDPQTLVADVIDHPSATRKSASLARLQVENGRSWSTGRDSAHFLTSRRCARVKTGGRPPA
jgi:hypothetical protein